MNYLETKCLTYTLGLSEITEHSYSEILNKLSSAFLLSEEKKIMLNNIISDDIFQTLCTYQAVEQYQNYVISFCKDTGAFGKKAIEFEALEIKKSVLRFVESVAKGSCVKSEIQNIFAQNKTNEEQISFFYGLLLFLSDTKSKKMYMDIFKELSSKAFTDASLMLLHLKNDEKNVHNIIHNLQLTADMNLNNAILQEICSHYGCKYEELEEGKGRKTFFWD